MRRYYCTYFDRQYLAKGVALIESLRRTQPPDWTIFVVCMDETTRVVLDRLGLSNVRLIPLHEIEARDAALLAVKPERSLVEYYWTLTPTVILRILERHRDIDVLTYLDADLFFFSSAQPLFEELGQGSVLIHEHRFSPRQQELAAHNGRFNVGLLAFRRDHDGLKALRWWRERCLEWCFARYEQGKMGDQLYLNDWPKRFPGVVVLEHVGAGVGPWNHDQYAINRTADGVVRVDGRPMIFYHFHSFKSAGFDAAWPVAHSHYPLTLASLEHCFVPYAEALADAYRTLRTIVPDAGWGLEDPLTVPPSLTMLAHRSRRAQLTNAVCARRIIALNARWEAYCSDQLIDDAADGVRRSATAGLQQPKEAHAAAASQAVPAAPTAMPGQHDLLSALAGTEIAKQIRTLYVGGAHRFQERALFDQLFPNLERIYLFEPIPELADFLRRFERMDSRVKVFCCALSDGNGARDFFLTNNDGESSSLLRLGTHQQIFPHVREVRSIQVTCRTLDSIIQDEQLLEPDMLVLDVQGAEYQILSSLSAELKARLLVLYVEASLEEVYAGAKCLDDLKQVLRCDHDLLSFAPLGPDSPTHGNALFLNRRISRPAPPPKALGSDTAPPLVSVIVSSYGAEAFMRECLTDLENQTIADRIEIIVIDAASPEQEGAVVREFQERYRNISYLRTPTRIGVYAAWNMAIKLAKGRYVTPFSTNDRLRREAYEILARTLEERPDVALVYGDTYLTATPHQTFERHDRVGMWRWPDYRYEFLLNSCCVGPHPMWRRDVHRTVGYFDESYVALGDQDFWIRVGAVHQLLHIPVVTGLYWRSPEGLSNRRGITEPEERRLRTTYATAGAMSGPPPPHNQNKTYDCSVIIPVWNRCELTRQCLAELANTTEGLAWELIVVDNHSTDETPAFLSSLQGDVRILRNQDNLGFAKACNQGAQVARGRYLVFLNNDTIPLNGWLNAMLNEVKEHPDVGVVGSKLLFPDNTVQHAGIVFRRSGLCPYHAYRRFPADSPAVNRRREFQAVTAACMLVRQEAFKKVGGFDEEFRNGFEDIDFCLKIRSLGLRVVYQPRSALYHLESQTPGRKDHEHHNIQVLEKRWKDHCRIGDEDLHYYADGYKAVGKEQEGQVTRHLVPLTDASDRDAWRHVAATQAAALHQDWGAARTELSAVDAWPDEPLALLWAAEVSQQVQAPDLHAAFLDRYLRKQEDPSVRVMRIHAAIEQNDLVNAEAHLERLLTCFPQHPEGLLLRGVLSMQREQYREAGHAFASALEQGADQRKCLMGMGMASMGLGSAREGWDRFLQVASKHPDDPEAVHWLLRAGTAENRWVDLSRHLRGYLMRNPGDLSVRFALAGVLFRAERIEEARQEYLHLRTLAPAYDGLAELGRLLDSEAGMLPSEPPVYSSAS
ncbi:MAG TPA: FkbM family methyltransferase [Nitrospira sp.]|nr:FkbM family methyltransferase [Nitrospira sp.]